ncbi:MAG: hypothetical protein AAF351_10160 [Pseudomonadota bacterium]
MMWKPRPNAIGIAAAMMIVASSHTALAEDEVDIAVSTPSVTFEPDEDFVRQAESQSPIRISYRVIGTPIVGQPVALDLQFVSQLDSKGFDVSYRINDMTALEFPESQATRVSIAATGEGQSAGQQVTVIPLREGRLFLNVAAIIETENGSTQHVSAIPIQVTKAVSNGSTADETSTEE